MLGQVTVRDIDPDVELGHGTGQAGQPVGQAQVVQDRGPQVSDGGAALVQGQVGQAPRNRELFRAERRRCGHRVGGGVEVVGQADQPLHDAVVDVAGQPAPLSFLGGDHLLGEAFGGSFPRGQLTVHPALVHGPGHEAADRGQQAHVAVAELTPVAAVHVEHAHEAAGPGGHRHRDHGAVGGRAQLGKIAVPGIGLLILGDGRSAVAGHPAGDPLPQRQLDSANLAVERRGGAGQRE